MLFGQCWLRKLCSFIYRMLTIFTGICQGWTGNRVSIRCTGVVMSKQYEKYNPHQIVLRAFLAGRICIIKWKPVMLVETGKKGYSEIVMCESEFVHNMTNHHA